MCDSMCVKCYHSVKHVLTLELRRFLNRLTSVSGTGP